MNVQDSIIRFSKSFIKNVVEFETNINERTLADFIHVCILRSLFIQQSQTVMCIVRFFFFFEVPV